MNVLLSAVGRRAYLVEYFKQIVNPFGGKVYATNTTEIATGYLAADDKEIVPPSSSKEYIPVMINLCKKWNIKLLFSLHDWDAPVIARNKDKFLAIGTVPVMANADILAKCLDKYQTFLVANEIGVQTPMTMLLTEENIEKVASNVLYPLIIKPRWGQGSIGLFKVNSKEEMLYAFKLSLIEAKKFSSTCPEIDPLEPQILAQQCICGEEFGCDIVNDLTGKFQKAFVKHKFGMRSGETDVAESVLMPKIEEYAEKIAVWSKHLGCMDSDFIVSKDGKPYLIELNPRFGGGYPFTHCAGANIPLACVNWAQGIHNSEWCVNYKEGIRVFKEISLKSY